MPDYLHYSIAQIATRPANEKGSPSIHLKKKNKKQSNNAFKFSMLSPLLWVSIWKASNPQPYDGLELEILSDAEEC